MNIVSKIRAEMYEKNIKQKYLVEYLGASQSNVSKWLSENEKIRLDLPNTILVKIAQLLHVDVAYLVGLQDEKLKINETANNSNFTMLQSYNIKAGAGAECLLPTAFEATRIPVANQLLNGCNTDFLHIIQVLGDSMEPTISSNDWLIIDMVSNGEIERMFENINGIYLINRDGIIQIKRLDFLGNKGIDIISDNSIYPTKNTLIDGIEIEIIGKLFKQVKDLGSLALKC